MKKNCRELEAKGENNISKSLELINLIYPRELEIEDMTESNTSASFFNFNLCIDNRKRVYRRHDKADDFNFNFWMAIFLWHLHTEFISLN